MRQIKNFVAKNFFDVTCSFFQSKHKYWKIKKLNKPDHYRGILTLQDVCKITWNLLDHVAGRKSHKNNVCFLEYLHSIFLQATCRFKISRKWPWLFLFFMFLYFTATLQPGLYFCFKGYYGRYLANFLNTSNTYAKFLQKKEICAKIIRQKYFTNT